MMIVKTMNVQVPKRQPGLHTPLVLMSNQQKNLTAPVAHTNLPRFVTFDSILYQNYNKLHKLIWNLVVPFYTKSYQNNLTAPLLTLHQNNLKSWCCMTISRALHWTTLCTQRVEMTIVQHSSPQTFITPYLKSDIHNLRYSSPQTLSLIHISEPTRPY